MHSFLWTASQQGVSFKLDECGPFPRVWSEGHQRGGEDDAAQGQNQRPRRDLWGPLCSPPRLWGPFHHMENILPPHFFSFRTRERILNKPGIRSHVLFSWSGTIYLYVVVHCLCHCGIKQSPFLSILKLKKKSPPVSTGTSLPPQSLPLSDLWIQWIIVCPVGVRRWINVYEQI